MNSLISAIKAFVLKNRPAYKDYLGNGKYDIKKLPEECVPDSVNDNIRMAQSKANLAYDTADSASLYAESAYSKANLAYDKASDINSRLFALTNLNHNFKTFEHTVAKEPNIRTGVADANGISDIPLAESTAPMECHFDIVLKDSNNNQIGRYAVFDRKIVRGITKISETYRLFIDERVKLGSDGYAELKIGYQLNSNDNLWHKYIWVVISLPSADINNSNISTVFIKAYGALVDVDNYTPWPSICVPLAGTNDAGVVYASDKTDDQTVPVSIDKNGYLWCKGSETTKDWNQNDPTASDYIKNRPGGYHFTTPTFSIEWDGKIGDKLAIETGHGFMCKVSDLILEPLQLKNCKIYLSNMEYEVDVPKIIGEGFVNYGSMVLFISNAPCVINNIRFEECGVYAMVASQGDNAIFVRKIEQTSEDVIRSFDINVLPMEIPHLLLKNENYRIDFTNISTNTEIIDLAKAFNKAMATGDYNKFTAMRNGSGFTLETDINSAANYTIDENTNAVSCYFWGTKRAIYYRHKGGEEDIFKLVGLYNNIPTSPEKKIYIASSTSGSKKKFEITVDDTGTISATEVT